MRRLFLRNDFKGFPLRKDFQARHLMQIVASAVFGYLIDKIKITEWKVFRKLTGDGKYLPWFRLTFFLFALFTVVFYLMPSALPVWAKIVWFVVTYLLYDFSCTLCEVPMNSLVMTLTDNTDERTHILTVKGLITVLAAPIIVPAMPYLLSFAAGAMLYVVVEELIPEMSAGEHSNIGVVLFAVGFSLMMALDVALE